MLKKIAPLVTIIAGLTIFSEVGNAQTSNLKPVNEQKPLITFIEPDYNQDAPGGRERGTGSRSVCSADHPNTQNLSLNALTPSKTRGLTTREKPSIWINITYPQAKNPPEEISAQFSLEEVTSNTKVIKDIPVKLPSASGTMKVEIPHTLEQGKWYRWYFVVDCGAMDLTEKNTVVSTEGLIQRQQTELDLKNPSENTDSETLARAYALKGIWYDALDEAAQLKCQKNTPDHNEQVWSDLLIQVNLQKLANEPLICH